MVAGVLNRDADAEKRPPEKLATGMIFVLMNLLSPDHESIQEVGSVVRKLMRVAFDTSFATKGAASGQLESLK